MTILATQQHSADQSPEGFASAAAQIGRIASERPLARGSLRGRCAVRKTPVPVSAERATSGFRREARNARGVRQRTTSGRGFTLIELMVVVVIVGVLAVLATVGFRKLIGSAHTTEATQMVQSIRVAQEAYHAETGTYADISNALCVTGPSCASLYPQLSEGASAVGDFKGAWGVNCTAGCNSGMQWLQLPLHNPGNVMYGYTTIAGLASSATSLVSTNGVTAPTSIGLAPTIGVTANFPNGIPSDWYLISAVGDEDMDGVPCVVFASSFSSDLAVWGEGN